MRAPATVGQVRDRRRLSAPLALLLGALLLATAGLTACGRTPVSTTWRSEPAPSGAAPGAPPGTAAPAKPYAVGVRQLDLSRGADRPLPTTVWYPAAGTARAGRANDGATPAPGRFPLVLFSHGLTALPQHYSAVTTRWAAAGFVVAAPAYPHTKRDAPELDITDITDIGRQPADATHVITRLVEGEPFADQIDTARIGAAGHSAGGFTTVGMFTANRDLRLRAGIVLAGGPLGGAYQGTAAPLLFVHGDADPTVSYATGRAAYDRAPWPKGFLTLVGGDHGGSLRPGARSFEATLRVTTDFLRGALYGDPSARTRLAREGNVDGVCRLDSTL